jgi:hypothetical protein
MPAGAHKRADPTEGRNACHLQIHGRSSDLATRALPPHPRGESSETDLARLQHRLQNEFRLAR